MSAPHPPHRPSLPTVIRRVALSLAIACVVPATLFYVCLRAVGVWPAIIMTLGWTYAALAWRAATRRRTSSLLLLTALVMTGRTLLALLSDSTFLYFLQPVIGDGVVAATVLLSLATARPMVARLAGDFYPMDRDLHLRPRVRRLFWHLTVMWAAIGICKGALTLWLLESTSLETFVLVKSILVLVMTGLAVVATVGAAVVVARKEGLMGPQAVHLVAVTP